MSLVLQPFFFSFLFQADKLLSPEFQPVLEQLVNHCSRKRQICLFSATFPVTVKDFKDRHISNPYEINLMDELTLKVRAAWDWRMRFLVGWCWVDNVYSSR